MKRFLLNFSYDGTDFFGWQKQKNEKTIQFEMENCLNKIFKKETNLVASGRTDRGVHSYNQYAHFDAQTQMHSENIVKAMNSLLPNSILIKNCSEVENDFHARFSAKSKIYLYKIIKKFSPFERNYATFFRSTKIDTKKIQNSIRYFVGAHDFEIFARDTSQLNTTLCTIFSVNWEEHASYYYFFISSNRFLHNMVRRIVGTIIKISDKDLPADYIQQIFEKQDYTMLGTTAPPNGLYLFDVKY
ncbi:MAG: tRNA pseudouridine(38-40) synthase TruA [Candidatus Cloacimonetes bacterium]|nr:tRNA pseudouridine(38-40) synthase TruA [Candidatus Cloacimonadota bacterium]MBL7108017.1 tRNA pseudouridine(38-40) synthase TruA [Candidatus Cloacimonadota bacterium]